MTSVAGEIAENIAIGVVAVLLVEGLLSPVATIVAAWRCGRERAEGSPRESAEGASPPPDSGATAATVSPTGASSKEE